MDIKINGTINVRKPGMEYIYTPIPIKISFKKETTINVIERAKILLTIKTLIREYILLIYNKKDEILNKYNSFNSLFIDMVKFKFQENKHLQDVEDIIIEIGDFKNSLDGVIVTPQTIRLNKYI